MTADRLGARPDSDLKPSAVTVLVAVALAVVSLALAPMSSTITHTAGLVVAAAAWTAGLLYFRNDRQLRSSPRYVGSSSGLALFLLAVLLAVALILVHSWFLARGLAV